MIRHLACIMDGNRRWAKMQGWMTLQGHRQGAKTVQTVVDFCLKKGIEFLSLYTFSLENFSRSEEEKNYLFDLLIEQSQKNLPYFLEKGIKVRFIGDRSLFPAHVLSVCEQIEAQTAACTAVQVNFLFCYGARQEIVAGVKDLMRRAREGKLSENDISDATLANYLWTAGIPEPEVVIRTGKMKRLSNFLVYQVAYSELFFLDCLWPELTEKHLEDVLNEFAQCRRNFGA